MLGFSPLGSIPIAALPAVDPVSFSESFDSGSSPWGFDSFNGTAGTLTLDTTNELHGTGCLSVATTANAGRLRIQAGKLPSTGTLYYRFYLKPTSTPSGMSFIFKRSAPSGANLLQVAYSTALAISIRDNTGTAQGGQYTMTVNTWYRVEIAHDMSANTMQLKVWSSPEGTGTPDFDSGAQPTVGTPDLLTLGQDASVNSSHLIDEFAISSSAWLGPVAGGGGGSPVDPVDGTAVTSSATGNTTTSYSQALASTTTGDMNIIGINVSPLANTTDPGVPTIDGATISTTPGGTSSDGKWTTIGTYWDTGSPGPRLSAVYRVRQSGDPTSVTIAWAQVGNYATVVEPIQAGTFDPTTPIEGGAVLAQAASSTTFPFATLTTTVRGRAGYIAGNRTTGGWTMPGTSQGSASNSGTANIDLSLGTAADAHSETPSATFTGSATAVGNTIIFSIVSNPGGGLISVSKAIATTWHTLASTSKSLATSWHTRALIAKALVTSWTVLAIVSKALSTTWNARAAITKAISTSWHALSTTNKAISTTWHTLSTTSKSLATSWNVNALIAKALSTTWNVAASLVSVSKAISTTWNTYATTSKALGTSWHTRAIVAATRSTSWNVLTSTAKTISTSWHTLSQTPKALSTTWNTRAFVTKALGTSWSVYAAIAKALSTSWTVRALVTATRSTLWHTLASVSASRSTLWHTLKSVAATRSTSWHVYAAVSKALSTTWNVAGTLVTVSKALATSWHTRALVTSTRSTSWNVRALVAKTLTTSWTVRKLIAATRSTTWHTLAKVSPTTRSTSWHTLKSTAKTLTTSWSVRALVGKALSTSWHTAETVGKSISTTWNILLPVVLDLIKPKAKLKGTPTKVVVRSEKRSASISLNDKPSATITRNPD